MKCQFYKYKISYLGFVIQYNTISRWPNKAKAIVNALRLKNVEDMKHFLGMIIYCYSRFSPTISNLTYLLRCLLNKNNNFYWFTACESKFIKLKDEISSHRVLIQSQNWIKLNYYTHQL